MNAQTLVHMDTALPPIRRRPAVFIQDFVDIDQPLEVLRRRICRQGAWLLPLAHDAAGDGAGFQVRVGPFSRGREMGVPVQVLVGPCVPRGDGIALPLHWEAVALGSLFPMLDGTIVCAPLDQGRCRLRIEASYRPPFDKFGELLDRAVLHRVGESTVRSFLQRVADALDADGDTHGGEAMDGPGTGAG